MKKSKCEICGKRYETYPIIIDNNPLSIASALEEETKSDGTKRTICKDCRDNLDKPKKNEPLTKEKETTAGYTNPYYQFPSDDVRSAVELAKEKGEKQFITEHFIMSKSKFLELIDDCFPFFKEKK